MSFPASASCRLGDLVRVGNWMGIVVGWGGYDSYNLDGVKTGSERAPLVLQFDGRLSYISSTQVLLGWTGET